MRVAVDQYVEGEIHPCRAVVLNADGEEISRRWFIMAADDEKEAFEAWVDEDGELVEHRDQRKLHHVETFPCPGLRITEDTP